MLFYQGRVREEVYRQFEIEKLEKEAEDKGNEEIRNKAASAGIAVQ